MESYLKSREWNNYEIYTDPGYSGKNLNRPAIQKLIKDCKLGKINTVLVFKLDRISRSQKDTLYLIEEVFNKYKVGFISIRENFDTTTPFGKAMIGILSVFAQLERETILERTRLGLKKRAEDGFWRGGGKIPFAYDYDKNSGLLIVNKERKTIFDLMKTLRLEGHSYHDLSKITGYDESWIQNILNCKTNLGLIPYKNEIFKGRHEAIINKEEYDEIQRINQKRTKHQSAKNYLLTGKIYCGNCGAKYRYQKWGKRIICYCYSQQKSKPKLIKDPNCKNIRLDSFEIENSFLEQLFKMSLDKNKFKENLDLISLDIEKELKNNLDKIKKKLERLIHFLYDGIAEKEVKLEIQKLAKQKEETIRLIDKIKTNKKTKQTYKNIKNLSKVWNCLEFIEQRNIVEQLLDKIVVTKETLEIYWNVRQN